MKIRKNSWILRIFKAHKIRILNLWTAFYSNSTIPPHIHYVATLPCEFEAYILSTLLSRGRGPRNIEPKVAYCSVMNVRLPYCRRYIVSFLRNPTLTEFWQEALLPQTNRATCYVSRNLMHNCRIKLYHKCTTNRSNEVLDGYIWTTCSKQPRLVDCRISVVNKLDRRRRRRRLLLTTRSICRGEIFLGWNSARRKCPYFWRYPNFFTTQRRIVGRKPPC